ncbi:hypothetical protein ABZX93_27860 [Streptomyces sp. NPDC006632]|uniref:hypothetical protein n=1 Tax=Streptomyces sp. NPDC006632 TaxID=3157182 RepID=UPI0033B235E6
MHRHIPTAGLTAVGLAAALVLTGCGSGDKRTDPASVATRAAASGSGGNGTATKGGVLRGVWTSDADKEVVLLFTSQHTVTLTGSHFCAGRFSEVAGTTMVKMIACGEGDKERSQGVLTFKNADALEVDWEGFTRETFRRTTNGTLPTEAPSL